MKRIKSLLILALMLVGCKTIDIDGINQFYRKNYFENESHIRFMKVDESLRRIIFSKFFRNLEKKKDTTIVIERFGYYGGNFDVLNANIFFYQNDSLIKAYYLKSDKKSNIEDITKELIIETNKTNELILDLMRKDKYEKLSQLFNSKEYSISGSGKIYVTFLDNNLKVIKGHMFNEFSVPIDLDSLYQGW